MTAVFDSPFVQQHPNRCFQYINIAEKFYRPKNAPNAASVHIENNPMILGLTRCNLAMQIIGMDVEVMRREMMHRSGVSGVGVDVTFVDFASFDATLNELRLIGDNYRKLSLPPMSERLHELLTSDADKFFQPAKSMAKNGPLKKMTEILRPYGLVTTNEKLLSFISEMEQFRTCVLTEGTCLDTHCFPMNIPIHKISCLHKLESPSNYDQPVKLFLVVGPSDEVLCGRLGDTLIDKPEAGEGTHTRRTVNDTEVSDQEYTATFVFGYAGETAQSVLENTVTRCRTYSKVPKDVSVYREAAVIQLGLVPNVGPHTLSKQMDKSGHVSTVQIDCFKVKTAPCWCYTTFQYAPQDDFEQEQTLLMFSYQQQNATVNEREAKNDDDSTQHHSPLSPSTSREGAPPTVSEYLPGPITIPTRSQDHIEKEPAPSTLPRKKHATTTTTTTKERGVKKNDDTARHHAKQSQRPSRESADTLEPATKQTKISTENVSEYLAVPTEMPTGHKEISLITDAKEKQTFLRHRSSNIPTTVQQSDRKP